MIGRIKVYEQQVVFYLLLLLVESALKCGHAGHTAIPP